VLSVVVNESALGFLFHKSLDKLNSPLELKSVSMRVELCLLAIVPLRLAFTGVRLGPVASSVLWQTVDGAGLVVSEGRAPTASQDVERFFSLASAGPSTGTAVIEGVKAHGRTLLVEAKRPSPRDEAWRCVDVSHLLNCSRLK
jgi:hypothetical protein